jgi:hypothetical protein
MATRGKHRKNTSRPNHLFPLVRDGDWGFLVMKPTDIEIVVMMSDEKQFCWLFEEFLLFKDLSRIMPSTRKI